LLGGDHLFRMSELVVTETELAAIATPARAGYRRPAPADGFFDDPVAGLDPTKSKIISIQYQPLDSVTDDLSASW
jgi:hypothetical protein